MKATLRSGWWLCGALGTLIGLSRVRAIATPFELNLDESHLMAQAMRYAADIVPWRAVDGATSGPLSAWLLLSAHTLGLAYSYAAVHAFAAVMLVMAVVSLYWAVRRALGPGSASVSAAALSAWIVADQDPDFVHFSTELLPVVLVSIALALALSHTRPALTVFLLGFVPWTKLQATPIAFLLGLWITAGLLWPTSVGAPGSFRWKRAGSLVLVAGLPSAVFLALIASGSALDEFWQSYMVVNRYYAGSFSATTALDRILRLATLKPISPWLIAVALSQAGLLFRKSHRVTLRERLLGVPALAIGLTVVSVMAVIRPESDFDHYELLLIPALTLLTGVTAHQIGMDERGLRSSVVLAWTLALLLFCTAYLADAARYLRLGYREPQDGVVEKVLAEVQRVAPGLHTYTYWGWAPSVYIETGTRPPARHLLAYLLTADSPSRAFMRHTFMQDVENNPTDIFLDLFPTGMGMTPLSTFPELDRYVHAHFAPRARLNTLRGTAEIYIRIPGR